MTLDGGGDIPSFIRPARLLALDSTAIRTSINTALKMRDAKWQVFRGQNMTIAFPTFRDRDKAMTQGERGGCPNRAGIGLKYPYPS